MVSGNLGKYRYSIILFLVLCTLLFAHHGTGIFDEIVNFLLGVNLFYFAVSGVLGYVAALSFLLPYAPFISKGKNLRRRVRIILNFVYLDVVGGEARKYLSEKLNIEKAGKTLRMIGVSDTISIILLTLVSLFFLKEWGSFIWILVFEILYVLVMVVKHRSILSRKTGGYTFLCFLRYFMEFPRTLFVFYAAGVFMDIPVVFIFLVSSSLLYFIPYFKNAGGLLEAYSALFFYSLGYPVLFGFMVAVLFRINAVVFHVIPFNLYLRLRRKPINDF